MNKEDFSNLKDLRDSTENPDHKKSLRKAMNYIYALESRINTIKVLSRTLVNEIHYSIGNDGPVNEPSKVDERVSVNFTEKNTSSSKKNIAAETQDPFQNIKNILENDDPVSGYKKIKDAAAFAVLNFGKDWIDSSENDSKTLRKKIENLVRSCAPKDYSDDYQFWYKFLNYAKAA